MVIALFALSLVMIVGGTAAVVQGFPYVRLESGLAMVIGGTTAASAGVVLLGLGAAVIQLKRLESVFGARRADGTDPLGYDPRATVPVAADLVRETAMAVDPPIPTLSRSSLGGTAGRAGLTLGAVAAQDEPGAKRPIEHEPLLPDLLPPDEPAQAGPDEDLFAHPDDRPGHVPAPAVHPIADKPGMAGVAHDDGQDELALRPALDAPAVAEATPAQEASPPGPDQTQTSERHAVGSYASGGNTYVMYSDGTIDADTPRGRFTFQSLDELKEFVATGEAGERGAA